MYRIALLTCWMLLLPLSVLADDEWGDLRGRFVYDGIPPEPEVIHVRKDVDTFGPTLLDNSLLVHPQNHGLANVVIYLLPEDDEKLKIHPSYEGTAQDKVKLTVQNGHFVPHVLLVRTSQTLAQRNNDKVPHIANFTFQRSHALLPASEGRDIQHDEQFRRPHAVFCNIHPWMKAYVLFRSNPYMAVTDGNGRFAIKYLPVGEHVLRVWHERTGWIRVPGVTDEQGRLTVSIQPGEKVLDEIAVTAEQFKRPD